MTNIYMCRHTSFVYFVSSFWCDCS